MKISQYIIAMLLILGLASCGGGVIHNSDAEGADTAGLEDPGARLMNVSDGMSKTLALVPEGTAAVLTFNNTRDFDALIPPTFFDSRFPLFTAYFEYPVVGEQHEEILGSRRASVKGLYKAIFQDEMQDLIGIGVDDFQEMTISFMPNLLGTQDDASAQPAVSFDEGARGGLFGGRFPRSLPSMDDIPRSWSGLGDSFMDGMEFLEEALERDAIVISVSACCFPDGTLTQAIEFLQHMSFSEPPVITEGQDNFSGCYIISGLYQEGMEFMTCQDGSFFTFAFNPDGANGTILLEQRNLAQQYNAGVRTTPFKESRLFKDTIWSLWTPDSNEPIPQFMFAVDMGMIDYDFVMGPEGMVQTLNGLGIFKHPASVLRVGMNATIDWITQMTLVGQIFESPDEETEGYFDFRLRSTGELSAFIGENLKMDSLSFNFGSGPSASKKPVDAGIELMLMGHSQIDTIEKAMPKK